jgi:rare lipoprotein A (peptidoglycan hydrolase)
MTPKQLFDYKQLKLGNVKYTGRPGVDESALNSALQESKFNIKTKMNAAMPELKGLNQDYGDLQSASDSMDKVITKQQREGLNGLGIKNLISAGLNNPVNRAKLAQWLYTAPKESISALEQDVPQAAEVVKSWFGAKSPELGVAGKTGFQPDIKAPVGNLEGMDANAAGKPSAEPQVTERPAPFVSASQKGWPAPDIKTPTGTMSGGVESVKSNTSKTLSPTEDPNGFLQESKNKMLGNKGQSDIKPTLVAAGLSTLGATSANAMSKRVKFKEGQTITGEASTYNWGEKGLHDTLADNTPMEKNSATQSFAAMSMLPMHSIVEVRDLKTGKTITIQTKDFGPGKRTHRVIDLSQGAWRQLGYSRPGLTNVKVTIKKLGTGGNYHGKY